MDTMDRWIGTEAADRLRAIACDVISEIGLTSAALYEPVAGTSQYTLHVSLADRPKLVWHVDELDTADRDNLASLIPLYPSDQIIAAFRAIGSTKDVSLDLTPTYMARAALLLLIVDLVATDVMDAVA